MFVLERVAFVAGWLMEIEPGYIVVRTGMVHGQVLFILSRGYDIIPIRMQTMKQLSSFIGTLLLMLAAFGVGVYVGVSDGEASADISQVSNAQEGKPDSVDFSPYWRAWQVINEKFVPASTSTRSVKAKEKLWGSIEGLAASLEDPHTRFLPPRDSEVFDENISGNFEGVGMRIGIRNGVLTVISPLAGSPAKRAGIQPQDKIIRIDGQSTESMSVTQAVKEIRGKGGTTVDLTIAREGADEPKTISVVREEIKIPTVRHRVRDDGIYVITLHNFSERAPHLFRQAIKSFKRSGSQRLILDLRGNPGGFLGASVEMASYFLPEGKVIVREDGGDKNEKLDHVFRSKGYDLFDEGLEMAVLVDGGTASASEILAGALAEHGVATLVGTQTFGKGSVQELVRITSEPETSLKVTVARWLTPDGHFISQGGLTPSVTVERTREQFRKGIDPQMQKAVELLKK